MKSYDKTRKKQMSKINLNISDDLCCCFHTYF